MNTFNVPTREEVSEKNKAIFDNLEQKIGFVPNLYATYAHSETALENYLNFQSGKISLKTKEKEVINLAVSEVNQCIYCLSVHTAIAKMNGFTDEEILERCRALYSPRAMVAVRPPMATQIRTRLRPPMPATVVEKPFYDPKKSLATG